MGTESTSTWPVHFPNFLPGDISCSEPDPALTRVQYRTVSWALFQCESYSGSLEPGGDLNDGRFGELNTHEPLFGLFHLFRAAAPCGRLQRKRCGRSDRHHRKASRLPANRLPSGEG